MYFSLARPPSCITNLFEYIFFYMDFIKLCQPVVYLNLYRILFYKK